MIINLPPPATIDAEFAFARLDCYVLLPMKTRTESDRESVVSFDHTWMIYTSHFIELR